MRSGVMVIQSESLFLDLSSAYTSVVLLFFISAVCILTAPFLSISVVGLHDEKGLLGTYERPRPLAIFLMNPKPTSKDFEVMSGTKRRLVDGKITVAVVCEKPLVRDKEVSLQNA